MTNPLHHSARESIQCSLNYIKSFFSYIKLVLFFLLIFIGGFLSGLDGKESACSAGDPSSIPGLGKSPGEGHGSPLQYSCLENPMDGGAWWATVHGVAKIRTQLSNCLIHLLLLYSVVLVSAVQQSESVTCLHT